ncbi:MAG: hypothetical protein HZB53_16050 [Chloroflexi bacterium]|nr:hypothetical protein [Chloroflexota bacterium]
MTAFDFPRFSKNQHSLPDWADFIGPGHVIIQTRAVEIRSDSNAMSMQGHRIRHELSLAHLFYSVKHDARILSRQAASQMA